MPETEASAPPAQPLFYRSLRPLDASLHSALRLKEYDFSFAAESPSIPIVVSEFAEASRYFPVVFAVSDATPLAVLGIDRRNVFLENGRWAHGVYVPAYARRYPFGFLRIDDSARFILGIDFECEGLGKTEGEPLFENGMPAAITQRALGFCEAFRNEAETTHAFVRALEGRDLLVERRADVILANGRNLGLDGFKVVDPERFSTLDAPTLAEWHARGWLALVTLHLTSLDRFRELLSRLSATSDETPSQPGGGDFQSQAKEPQSQEKDS
ncbi:SapC family protein [Sphingobium sp. AS12]|uniref:SapC family protein n=1 Tax=Sphingobium sp. AS12 TaxID=2849495 RepID=UPI001C318F89|nr:SapC family protein [Sphingobium sp. AS12]MBV2150006.1 SapC family protein [Sphingobium sp. AS12]